MKIESFSKPQSSFLSMEKDIDLIIGKMLKNDRLKRLLFYDTKDCMSKPNLTDEQSIGLINTNIRTIPRLALGENVQNYIIISFDNFTPNHTNPYFRDNVIQFDIICNFSQWHIANGQLRPYRIAAEIDSMFNNKHLSGIGTLEFLSGLYLPIDDNNAGITLIYGATHGDEDKKGMISEDQESFEKEYNAIWNDK